jgi:hypothetical protein
MGRRNSNAERSVLRSVSRTAAGGVSVSTATVRPSRPRRPLYARYPVRSCGPANGHNPPSLCQNCKVARVSKAAVCDVRDVSTQDVAQPSQIHKQWPFAVGVRMVKRPKTVSHPRCGLGELLSMASTRLRGEVGGPIGLTRPTNRRLLVALFASRAMMLYWSPVRTLV